MLFGSLKQEVIIIAETNASSVARITEELQNKGLYNFKFAVNGAEIYKITREYYENPKVIGLIIVSNDLPDCQIKELYNFFSHAEEGVFIPLIVLKKDSSPDGDDWKLGSRNLVYHLKQNYSSIELQMVVDFFICLKNEK